MVANERGSGTVRLSVVGDQGEVQDGLHPARRQRSSSPPTAWPRLRRCVTGLRRDYLHKLVLFLAVTLTVQLVANWFFGLYGRIWRHAGIEEARNIVLSCLATLCVLTVLYPLGFAERLTRVPFLVLPSGLSPDDAGDRRTALPLPTSRLAEGEPRYGLTRRRHRQPRCRRGRRAGHAAEPVRRSLPGRGLRRRPADARVLAHGRARRRSDRRHSGGGREAPDPADPARRSPPVDRPRGTVCEVGRRGQCRLEDRARPAATRRIGERALCLGPLCP